MTQEDAIQQIEFGITFEYVRELLLPEYDGTPSIVIVGYTKAMVHLLVRTWIDGKYGMVHPKSADALMIQIGLREFG
jgi:hypothetical protein